MVPHPIPTPRDRYHSKGTTTDKTNATPRCKGGFFPLFPGSLDEQPEMGEHQQGDGVWRRLFNLKTLFILITDYILLTHFRVTWYRGTLGGVAP